MTFCSVYLHRLRCQGSDLVVKTSRPSSAVADRPRDACLSVLASTVSYNTSSALFYYLFFFGFIRFTSACNSILFCYLQRNVEPCCDTHWRDRAWSVSHCTRVTDDCLRPVNSDTTQLDVELSTRSQREQLSPIAISSERRGPVDSVWVSCIADRRRQLSCVGEGVDATQLNSTRRRVE